LPLNAAGRRAAWNIATTLPDVEDRNQAKDQRNRLKYLLAH
jgi:hypothetical protein